MNASPQVRAAFGTLAGVAALVIFKLGRALRLLGPPPGGYSRYERQRSDLRTRDSDIASRLRALAARNRPLPKHRVDADTYERLGESE